MSTRKYPFAQVDAFTQTRLQGNPCAVILDADDLTNDEMLAIAREMNLSETSFVSSSAVADFRFRYFTPAEELPLAGHPTIAMVFYLVECGRIRRDVSRLTIELLAGVIEVFLDRDASGLEITMNQLPPRFTRCYQSEEILRLFGLDERALWPVQPIQTVSTGTPMLMLPLRSISELDHVQFDAVRLAEFRVRTDFYSVHLFALGPDAVYARHFCPWPDVPEDPFTGSAAGAMGCYLWRYGLIAEPHFIAKQGSHLNRPGVGRVAVVGSRENIESVRVSGRAITCIEGTLLI